MKKNKKGFTLIELLAVIVILGIILTIVVSNVVKYINQARTGSYVDAYQIMIKDLRTQLLANEMNNGSASLTVCKDSNPDDTYKDDAGNSVSYGACNGKSEYNGLYDKKNIKLDITGDASNGYKITVTPTDTGSFKGVDLEKTETDNTTISRKNTNDKYTILDSTISSDGTVSATTGITGAKTTTTSASK